MDIELELRRIVLSKHAYDDIDDVLLEVFAAFNNIWTAREAIQRINEILDEQ